MPFAGDRGRVPKYFDHEAQTRYWLIDPMLRALGWDLSDAEQVCPEFYYDYADSR